MSKFTTTSSKDGKAPIKKNANEILADLLRFNIDLLSQNGVELISDEIFEQIGDKKSGMTVGKIVTEKTKDGGSDATKKRLLIKKNGRLQEFDEAGEIASKDRSRDMKLQDGITESFNEKCAAVLFNILKKEENYLPEISLVRSGFNSEKPHNKLKSRAGLFKVYVASEIIGDPTEVNQDKKSKNKTLLTSAPNKDLLRKDLCENAVIMFVLSNYDLKLDNFIAVGDRFIPIDFGNARCEEKLSPDIINGIDAMRSIRNKEASSQYASAELKERFADKHHENTQKFYKENLHPEHFLSVIAKIKENQTELEMQLRQNAVLYTFGTSEEKQNYADVVVARVRNLVKLEPILTSWVQKNPTKKFSDHNLRTIIVNSKEFEDDLMQTNSSEGKKFFRHISNLFESINERGTEIISLLDQHDITSPSKAEIEKEILSQVAGFNQFLENEQINIQEELIELAKHYSDSEYVSGKNIFGSSQGSWQEDASSISQKLSDIIDTLAMPLAEDRMNFDQSINFSYNYDSNDKKSISVTFNNSNTSYSEEEYSYSQFQATEKSNSSTDSDSSEEDNKILTVPTINSYPNSPKKSRSTNWDLSKSQQYSEALREMMSYASEEHETIRNNLLRLMTHLAAHDTLLQVKLPSPHVAATTNTTKQVAGQAVTSQQI